MINCARKLEFKCSTIDGTHNSSPVRIIDMSPEFSNYKVVGL